jgi:cytosine/uracil/thiamine/allantoin permease
MKLIPNWKKAWRMFSVQAQALAISILATWASIPEDWKPLFDQKLVFGLAMACLVFGIVGRVVAQPTTQADPPKEPNQ